MTVNLTTIVVASVLVGTGTYLFLSRSLVRALMGFLLMGNGVNLLFIAASGPAGAPPIVGESDRPMVDPVPQALVLTAIVITLGMTAFVLALAHRGRQLSGRDLVDDDTESARIHARAEADLLDSPSARDVAAQIAAGGEEPESRYHDEDDDEGADGDDAGADADGGDARGAGDGGAPQATEAERARDSIPEDDAPRATEAERARDSIPEDDPGEDRRPGGGR